MTTVAKDTEADQIKINAMLLTKKSAPREARNERIKTPKVMTKSVNA